MHKKILFYFLFSAIFLIPKISLAAIDFDRGRLWSPIDKTVSDFVWSTENLQDFSEFNIQSIDLGGDGVDELVISAKEENLPYIKILRQNGFLINSWLAYKEDMTQGVELSVGDLDGDNKDEIITGVTQLGGSHVRIFDGYGNLKFGKEWFAFPEANTGVKIATIDANQDGRKEIATAIYHNNQIKIKVFNRFGENLDIDFIVPYDLGEDFKISRVDLGGDQMDEILLSSGADRFPKLYIYRLDGSEVNNFLSYEEKFKAGFRALALDIDNDHKEEIITVPQLSGGPHVKIFDGYGNLKNEFMAFSPDLLTGLNLINLENKLLFFPAHKTTGRTDLEKYIDIDLSEQNLKFFDYSGIEIASFPVSSGLDSLPTPIGEFTIDYKQERRYSRAYGLYMPWWMAFNVQKGYGLHELPEWPNGYKEGADHLGKKASHGCVRLGVGPAEYLYKITPLGTKVIIHE